jgi:hypothetical protein
MSRISVLATVAVALALCAVPATAAVGAPAGGATTGTMAATGAQETISGTVETTDGETFSGGWVIAVPAANASMVTQGSPTDVRDMARSGGENIYSTQIGEDGSYSLTVPSTGTYVVAATDGATVSNQPEIQVGSGGATQDLTIRPFSTIEPALTASEAAPGENMTLLVRMPNPTEHPLGPVEVGVGPLPDGWEVVSNQSTDGTFVSAASTWEFDTFSPGTRAAGSLTIAVPDDTEPGEYEIPIVITAGDEDALVETSVTATIVGAEGTMPPSTTATTAMDMNGTATSTATEEDGGGGGLPGFGPIAVLAALGLLVIGIRRR